MQPTNFAVRVYTFLYCELLRIVALLILFKWQKFWMVSIPAFVLIFLAYACLFFILAKYRYSSPENPGHFEKIFFGAAINFVYFFLGLFLLGFNILPPINWYYIFWGVVFCSSGWLSFGEFYLRTNRPDSYDNLPSAIKQMVREFQTT